MTSELSETKLEQVLGDLLEISLRPSGGGDALQRLTELCCEALGSRACTLVWIDLERHLLTQVACTGFDEAFKAFMAQNQIRIGPLHEGVYLDYDLIARGEVIRKYNLPTNRGGVANPEVAKKYNLRSALCQPLKIDGRVVGLLNHFSSGDEPFTEGEENLLRIFSRQAENIIKQSNTEKSLKVIKDLVNDLQTLSPTEFLEQLPNRACDLIQNSICLVWKLDPQQGRLRIAAASNEVDDEYRGKELDYEDVKHMLVGMKAKYLSDVTESGNLAEAKAQGWVSLLSVPMHVDKELIGLLDVYTKYRHHFTEFEREKLEDFAAAAAVCIQKADLQRETSETLNRRQRFEEINRAMTQMAEARHVDQVLSLLLHNSCKLVGVDWGWVRRLNPASGLLEVTAKVGITQMPRPLRISEGITWKALIEQKTQIANDVSATEWSPWYVEEFSPETKSELAIPLLIDNVAVREGTEIKHRSKPIGVLNLESPKAGAFSETHITYLLPLVRQAALLIEQLEAEQLLNGLREVERKIVGKQNWRDVLQIVVEGIRDTLGFEHVNVSLVEAQHNRIKSEYVVGIPDDEAEAFKRMAVCALDSSDIQADIVRSRRVEVPLPLDPRFDQKIYERFRHRELVRVFIPMIAPSNGEVIGTVEAGYKNSYRGHIYERDIRFLQSFLAYAVEAIEPSRRTLLETISHEFRSSIGGIRSNADYLRLLWPGLTSEMVRNKLNDILADSEILMLNVGELEFFLGRTSQAPRVEETLVMRDIVIKTVNQLKPLVRERGFEPRKIDHPRTDLGRIRVWVEKAKLNQVVYNLLLNSIKYAEDDPEQFFIRIRVDETDNDFVVKFADWGMGIRAGLEERIFEVGFRATEARAKNVSGSGLGLTIARERMQELGGKLILAHNHKPTEFHIIIPKKLKEAP
jgi:GAF domain-containing protein/signal transduction histidine kinase